MERRGTKRSLPSQEVCKPSTDRKEDLAFDLAKSEGEGVCVCVSGGAGAKWRYEGTIVDRGGSARGIMIHDFITILCHVGFSVLQDKAFQGNTIWRIFRLKWVKIKIFVIILYLL